MDNDIAWELCRSFLAVLQEGSLSGAARSLGITQPTVGRHIATLEKSLGVALFTRSQTGLIPTEAALATRSHAELMKSAAAAFQRAAENQGDGVKGTVRVSASEVIGVEVLPAIIADLQQRHTQLKVELVLTNRLQDLLHREADIAIRMTAPQQDSLIARQVGTVTLGLYAHKNYLEQRGFPQALPDLTDHLLIGFDEETPFIRAARRQHPEWKRQAFSLRTDSDIGQLALIRSGCGIGVCQEALAQRNPLLIRVLPQLFELKLETWVVMHEDLRHSPRCKETFDALVKGLANHVN
ncbi:LysR family transcriptional regulator [Iodobacter fluviatilis]|uniref:HTH-type transcriptional regulator AbgR n=1 Tax=Iodobacter fluviatilis TaxID=537 RepID=A0A377QDL2_9NEIS|nr:LysR family transcriptional regulator [Iodobacter fluviatilis]TCU81396.1 LysR family transcriptional regulator [Iodobacter fluviatilis]STQ91961.1 HTH-type transcriptional regulator AbgR [Iodobacter fluviatilis]